MIAKNAPLRRRRLGGAVGGSNANTSQTPESHPDSSSSPYPVGDSPTKNRNSVNYTVGPSSSTNSKNISASGGSSELNTTSDQQPPNLTSSTTSTTTSSAAGSNNKPCHAARLVLLCCQNALRMGARTQLGLCPPGRARRDLKAALRTQTSRQSRLATATRRSAGLSSSFSAGGGTSGGSGGGGGGSATASDVGGYFGIDKMIGPDALDIYSATEEEFLVKANTFDADSDEEASSGDDDDLIDMQYLLNEDSPELDDEKKYTALMEPLFTPIGAESGIGNTGGGPLSVGGVVGKLPFNRRKLRYFDSVSAHDTMSARAYLQQEAQRSKRREVLLLAKHLKRTQRRQRRQIKEQRGLSLNENDYSDPESEEINNRSIMPSSVSKFEYDMTPSMAASLLVESLELNSLESVEGMAKCYDGIVAAGVALLESNLSDPTTPTADTSAPVATRPQIMAALTPLLITSLEQPSGDVIVSLARLRRMCGTPRYQRRFVQRVAPALIRPPRGAMWCLRHQNDMEPILAAAELIFDCAFEIFSKGWYDRGQLLLADTKRAETLNTAAMQLKNLSSNSPNDMLTLDLGHNAWRSNKYKAGKDPKGSKEPLAEWEVIAVDRQIRLSITNIISMDWSKVVVHSREAALTAASSYHRSRQAARQNRSTVLLQATSSGDMSPRSIPSSPLSPARHGSSRPHIVSSTGGTDTGDLHTSTGVMPPSDIPRSKSPIPTVATSAPLSPQPPSRFGGDSSPSVLPPPDHTPPRSPTPTHRETSIDAPSSLPQPPPSSPRRGNSPATVGSSRESNAVALPGSTSPSPVTPQIGGDRDRAPLSPPSTGMSTPLSDVGPPHRMSSASSVASTITGMTGMTGITSGTQPSHYRMLTSTAAERKRTVAACRALRAQITRFEEAFIQLHGRAPKGAAERAPLATTYAQYREWKRAIRADAACRIQALFRGACTRWVLLRSGNEDVARIIKAVAERRVNSAKAFGLAQSPGQDASLGVPTEISDHRRSDPAASPTSGVTEVFPSPGEASNQALAPTWGGPRRRSGSPSDGYSIGSPVPRPSVPSPSVSSPGSRTSGDMGRLSLAELQNRKRELKQQLKQYDMNFARRNGRMPVKAEKEPIRHLYERYNALKSQITTMEQEGRQTSSPAATQQSAAASAAAMNHRTTVTPVGSDSEDSGAGGIRHRSHRTSSSSSGSTSTAGAPTQENLAALRTEKGRLHQMLRSYEKDFFREHQRQVSSFADIRPVASQYRRYKEIKRAIAQLQQSSSDAR